MRVYSKTVIIGICCSILNAPLLLSAKPSALNPDQAKLNIIYARFFRVAQEPDAEGYLAFLQDQTTSDWSAIDETGKKHSRAEQIQVTQDVAAGRASVTPPQGKTGKISWGIDKFIFSGDTAIVRYHFQQINQELNDTGKYGVKGSHFITRVVRHRDTWIKTPNGWRWKLSEEGHPELIQVYAAF